MRNRGSSSKGRSPLLSIDDQYRSDSRKDEGITVGIVDAKMVTVWDGLKRVEVDCVYFPAEKLVTDIGVAGFQGLNERTDQFVQLPNGDELRESDGITIEG